MAKMKKAVTMSDIAKRLDVSTVTVSKALSGQKGVSDEMRDIIKEMAISMGYTAKHSLMKESYNIGVLISERYLSAHDSFYWKMYREVADYAIHKNSFTMFEIVSEAMEEQNVMPKLLEENKVVGLIIIGSPGYDYMDYLKQVNRIPMVFLDFYDKDNIVDCVISDGFYGSYILTNYLFDKGHKDIAYVGTLFSTESITDRYLGYIKALIEHGVEPRKDYLIEDRDVRTGLREEGFTYKFPEKMPTAFVCNCDFIASMLIKVLQEKGYRVPQDVSVVGYDDFLYPDSVAEVGITTYQVDIKEMAKAAINVLVKKLNGEPYNKKVHIVEGHMVEKKSVAERKS